MQHVHNRDPLSIVSTAYSDFMQLLNTKRGHNESCRNFESRFAAAVAKLRSHASEALPESLTALIFLANSNIDNNQRISVLAAATSTDSFWNSSLPISDSDLSNL